jgi:hypothetical protein
MSLGSCHNAVYHQTHQQGHCTRQLQLLLGMAAAHQPQQLQQLLPCAALLLVLP